jgi:two-component system sensor histidine kinase UhpB
MTAGPEFTTPGAGGGPDPLTPGPGIASEKLQLRALQAMCRQVFGFRLAMIALAAPAALLNAAPGLGARLVGGAVVVTFMVSYVLFRDWERFGPLLLRHPTLLAADTLVGSLLLVSAGPDTTLAYVSVCTPLLAGLLYSWRGAACFASLQSLILLLVHATLRQDRQTGVAESLLLPGLCVIAGAMGSTLRNLMLRFGAATQALTEVQARLAVTEAVSAERARLAREMHDSVTKTLYGVALAADGLAASAAAGARTDPALLEQQADLVSRSARRAAAEARELLTDLRRDNAPTHVTDLLAELAELTADFRTRTGLPADFHGPGDREIPRIPGAVARHLLSIASEALENAHRHAAATRVEVRVEVRTGVRAGVRADGGAGVRTDGGADAGADVRADTEGILLSLGVHDDGRGLPPGTTLERLRHSGHFGLVGMAERAATIGARLHIGPRPGPDRRGTEVLLELPYPATPDTPPPAPDPAPPLPGAPPSTPEAAPTLPDAPPPPPDQAPAVPDPAQAAPDA